MNDDIERIAVAMTVAKLPLEFVLRVVNLATEIEGIADLMALWHEATCRQDRARYEADLYEALEDFQPKGQQEPVDSMRSTDRVYAQRKAFKEHLRQLVEEHGGVSEVARQAEMPQPSLSRLLNSMSQPRPFTLTRLAQAMGLPVAALRPSQGRREKGLIIDMEGYSPQTPEPPTFAIGRRKESTG